MAVVGVASVPSRASARRVSQKYGANFPNAVDLGTASASLYRINPRSSYGFVIDEEGKIVFGFNLGYYRTTGEGRAYVFELDSEKFLKDAKDPFGLEGVPGECTDAWAALKRGQFGPARALAKRLTGSGKADVKGAAERMIAAADETEKKRLELMEKLATRGRAGELQEEMKAFLLAFPRTKHKGKLRTLTSKAKSTAKGRQEALSALNFERVLGLLAKNNPKLTSQALRLCRSISEQFGGTYYGRVADMLFANWNPGG